jgi:Rod binding domain-containing protein
MHGGIHAVNVMQSQLAAPAAAPSPKLVSAAHEFEAQMMKELLKPMNESDPLTGEEDDSSSGSGGALAGFASEALGQALSRQGGLGIAQEIVHELTPRGNKRAGDSVTGKGHGNTH